MYVQTDSKMLRQMMKIRLCKKEFFVGENLGFPIKVGDSSCLPLSSLNFCCSTQNFFFIQNEPSPRQKESFDFNSSVLLDCEKVCLTKTDSLRR